jgi:hypothetical protein
MAVARWVLPVPGPPIFGAVHLMEAMRA